MEVFQNVIGYEGIKAELRRIVDILNNPSKYDKLGVQVSSGLMLVGPPGTGKTTICTALLNAINRNKYTLRKNKADGAFVEEITKTFQLAKKNNPSIVFLDDIDKYSDNDERHPNSDEFSTLQSCIDDVKGSNVFVIATANNIRNLPGSLKRTGRFDKIIEVAIPTLKEAEKIIEYYLNSKPNVSKDIDVSEIARFLEGETCSTLETVINEAGILAAYDNKDIIEMNDILKACLRIIFNAPESYENKSKEMLTIASIHECGHTVAAEVLEKGSVNLVSIGNYISDIGGFTSITKNDDYMCNVKYMENRVISLLAGKAATEILLGIQDTGANSDISRAFRIVTRFVDNYTMYGFGNYDDGNNSSNTEAKIKQTTSIKMEDYYRKAKDIIFSNKEFLLKLSDILLEKTYITQKDIQEVRDKLNM